MIVNVSSISGVLAPPTLSSSSSYGTAKAALNPLTKAGRGFGAAGSRELCRAGIYGYAVDERAFGAEYPQAIAKASAGFPLQRLATADEVAGAILGLITGGDFVTGQTLIVDGGLSLS